MERGVQPGRKAKVTTQLQGSEMGDIEVKAATFIVSGPELRCLNHLLSEVGACLQHLFVGSLQKGRSRL